MATKKKTGKIIITILVIAVVLYLIYIFMQSKGNAKKGGEWHSISWGGSQAGGTEVLLCCSNDIQNLLQIGDEEEIQVDACSRYRNYIGKTSGHMCETKPCVCRGDLSGVHEVVGFGDDEGKGWDSGEYSGFRIKTSWESSGSPTPDIISGKWRKVAKNTWF